MLAKERDCAPPRIGRSFGVVNLWALVIEKRMIRAGIYHHFYRLAERLHITL
jgi:hypothetical protein